jgi:hypothetical protein
VAIFGGWFRRDESWFWNSETSMRLSGIMIGKLGGIYLENVKDEG